MATAGEEQRLEDLRATVIDAITARLASRLTVQPELADVIASSVDDRFDAIIAAANGRAGSTDAGLSDLIGLGAGAPAGLVDVPLPSGVEPYDEQVASERITGIADLYYLYQHE